MFKKTPSAKIWLLIGELNSFTLNVATDNTTGFTSAICSF